MTAAEGAATAEIDEKIARMIQMAVETTALRTGESTAGVEEAGTAAADRQGGRRQGFMRLADRWRRRQEAQRRPPLGTARGPHLMMRCPTRLPNAIILLSFFDGVGAPPFILNDQFEEIWAAFAWEIDGACGRVVDKRLGEVARLHQGFRGERRSSL